MVDLSRKFDVLVIGGGNAALCAAISARRAGASVLVLEGAPKFYRGGNTRHDRANLEAALHDSLRRLGTDVIDLYQLHWPNRGSYHFRQAWRYAPAGIDKVAETANMTQQNILQQAGASVLAQANQAPQILLRFFQ